MGISKFYIMNEKSVRWSLNSPEQGVFTNPSGFGIDFENNYLKVGDMWLTNSSKQKQPTPSGKIVFPKNPYPVFQEFINFLNAAKQLVLVYQPAGIEKEYFAEIDLVSIQKGGYNKDSVFSVPVKFSCKSLFYTEEQFEYHIERASNEIRWDFSFPTKFNDANYFYFAFDNDGHVEAPFMLSFIGYCLKPEIQVLQNGVQIQNIKFNVELQTSDRLTISTFDDNLFVEINGESRLDVLDFTKENFFKLPKGSTEIFFKSEAGRMNDITMSFEKYYKGV